MIISRCPLVMSEVQMIALFVLTAFSVNNIYEKGSVLITIYRAKLREMVQSP